MASWRDMVAVLGGGRGGPLAEQLRGRTAGSLWDALNEGAYGQMNRGFGAIMEDDAAWRAEHPAQAQVMDAIDLMTMGGPSTGMIKAFHGSPYLFNKFSASNIGTGEGAQAFGHGLYFAENPAVADAYKTALARPAISWNGKRYGLSYTAQDVRDPRAVALNELLAVPHDVDNKFEWSRRSLETLSRDKETTPAAIEQLNEWQRHNAQVEHGGYLYDVTLERPEVRRGVATRKLGFDDLLDFDAKISEQSERVRDKLAPIVARYDLGYANKTMMASANPKLASYGRGDISGRVLLERLGMAAGGTAEASRVLRENGIPGLSYSDGLSRNVPGSSRAVATRNIVMFDDDFVSIDAINGKAIEGMFK